jgi:PAS domain S-box-containing protein
MPETFVEEKTIPDKAKHPDAKAHGAGRHDKTAEPSAAPVDGEALALLRTSETRYRRLFETAQDGILLLDAKTGKITDVNPFLLDLLGYRHEEVVEKKLWEIGSFVDREAAKRAFERLQKDEYIRYENLPLETSTGARIHVEFVSNVYLVDGKKVIQCNIRDISRRRQAEASLGTSQERYRVLFNEARDGIALADAATGTLLDCNAALCQMVERDKTELLGQSQSILHSVKNLDGGESPSFLVHQTADPGQPLQDELLSKSGKLIPVEIRAARVQLEGRSCLLAVFRDITERKRADEMLRVKDSAIESSVTAMAISDLAGCLTYVNPAFVRLWGYESVADAIGRPLTEFSESAEKAAGIASAVRAQGRWSGDEVVRRAGGALLQVRMAANLVVDAVGHPICMLASFEDVTERRKAEDAQRESENKYRSLVDNVPGIIFTIDPKGTLTFVSRQAREVLGYESEEAIGKSVLAFVPEEDHQRVMEAVQRGMAGKKIRDLQVQMAKKSGERLLFECSFTRIHEAGRVTGAQGTAVDITERKRAETKTAKLLSQQQAVNHLALALGVLRNPQDIYRCLAKEVGKLQGTDSLILSQFDRETNLISALYVVMGGEEMDAAALPSVPLAPEGGGMQSQVLRSGSPLYIPDWAAHEDRLLTKYAVTDDGAVTSQIPSKEDRETWTKSAVFVPLSVHGETTGVMQVQSDRLDDFDPDDIQLLAGMANVAAVAIQNSQLYSQVESALDGIVRALATAAETRDPYTAGHQHRVAVLACAIGTEVGLPVDKIENLRTASLLHDIGKLRIPAEILAKPSALSTIEMSLIREHPQAAYEILKGIPLRGAIAEVILQHHERLDGSGYPQGLKGAAILPEARILAVADVVEAIVSHRPYRPALGIDAALDAIRDHRGKLYDPDVVDACVRLFADGFAFPTDGPAPGRERL